MADGTICGREYTVVSPTLFKNVSYTGPYWKRSRKPGSRILVDGIMHPGGGLPIRFKSLDRAERHIKNFKLER